MAKVCTNKAGNRLKTSWN